MIAIKYGRLAIVAVIEIAMATAAYAADGDIQARVKASGTVTNAFVKQLGGTMQREMKAGGPGAAMKVCREVAPSIANEISLERGWRVTRVSNRLRNPLLGTPDAWEQTVLQEFETRLNAGEDVADIIHFEVVEEPAGKSFRFMKAIAVAPQCVVCHGRVEQMPDAVRARINQLYPHDSAVNYNPGDLRGAISIKQPMGD